MSYKVWSDIDNNRLYLKIKKIEVGESIEIKDKIKNELSKLTDGFICISDFSQATGDYDLMLTDIFEEFLNMHRYLRSAKMKKMIRIVDPRTYMISKIVECECKEGLPTQTVYSEAMAGEALAGE